jgi:AcrR family transcriptional regulator
MEPRAANPIQYANHAASSRPRGRRRGEARPQEILDAALSVFVEYGFAAARTDEIAKRAGVTKGTLYLYFASKEAIFKSLLQESLTPQLSHFVKEVGKIEGSSTDAIRLIIRGLGKFMCHSSRAALPKLMLAEIGNFPELARFYKSEVIDLGLDMFESIIQRGIARGEFRPMDPKHGARLVMMPVSYIGVWRTSFGRLDSEAYDYEALLEAHLDLVLRGLTVDAKA